MSEKKYIDADLLKSELKTLLGQGRLEYMGVYDCVNSIPVADVEEVRHGEWIPISDYEFAECSECGEYQEVSDCGGKASFRLFLKFYKYCPCCGAKMDMTETWHPELKQ